MHDIQAILDRLRKNEEIARKFSEIEAKILSVLNFKDLFEVLLAEIKEKFRVPFVWLSMIDKSDVSSLIQSLESSERLKERMTVVDRHTFLNLIGNRTKPVLVNHNLDPYFPILPQHTERLIKSIAIAPISLDGEIIGSMNQADFSRKRFQPGIDTSSLELLAVKVSICLSNVTAHEKLKFMAYHDPLTGLLNRRVMKSILEREFNRSRRYDCPLSVVFMDLDGFKGVNDAYGHDRGDELLAYVADRLMKMSRDSDTVARFAGDEFVMILPQTNAENAAMLMKRIQRHFMDNPLQIEGTSIPVSISFGGASTEDAQIRDAVSLLKKADEMLYRAKTSKKRLPKVEEGDENEERG
jgi:diguanylate cyclase (GGDEF)-like protein